ncbi:extracellular solute-binding protein [Acuticoccus sp.]|uniref:extracellular solute-binding protein n=1 Tax=Acuticoccus sp. TaxID=1904378 RepID=UPI003B52514B
MRRTLLTLAVLAIAGPAAAQGEVNLYSSRHYDTDEALYDNFTERTGIEVNRIEDEADILIERMMSEGELSPADVFITVDAGRLRRADEAGLLQPLDVPKVGEVVPESLRTPNWAAVTTRARLIFYDENDVSNPPQTYQALADPKYEGMVCTRSSSNVYMLGLLASIIIHDGEEAARQWAEGVKDNLARAPEGGDTDQLRAIVSGECDIVLSNHYYYARAARKEVAGLSEGLDQIGVVFPNRETTGTHINVSGMGIAANSPNLDNAKAFVAYLLSPEAQKLIADGNDEYPVLPEVEPSEAVQEMGDFVADDLPVAEFADMTDVAQRIYNEVGYD